MENDSGSGWKQAAGWAWENRDWVIARLAELRRWLIPPREESPKSSIVIVGPGGVGKSTFAQIISGELDGLLDIPGAYEESINLERFVLDDDPDGGTCRASRATAPAGCNVDRRREDYQRRRLSAASSSPSSYGYHSLGEISYKHHRLYHGDKAAFLSDFLRDCRDDEIDVLRRLAPHIRRQ